MALVVPNLFPGTPTYYTTREHPLSRTDHDSLGPAAGSASGLDSALLEVRALPWRPRTRVMKASRLRDFVADGDPTMVADDIVGAAISLGVWLAILVAAPLIVLLLAVGLFSVELPLAFALAVLLVVGRFAGVVPWTVVIVDRVTGTEQRETYRNLLRAVRRIRSVNVDRRVTVRWAWA